MASLHIIGGLVADASGVRPADIFVDGDRITSVVNAPGPRTGAPPADGAAGDVRVIDATGLLVTPGLIDAHTHLLSSGEDNGYERELLHVSLPLRALRGAAHARAALDHGFTTMRDVCTEGAEYADVALRDAVRAGLFDGPRVVPSGPGIGVTGGYLPNGYAPHICAPHGCSIVDGVEAARREVRLQVSHGAEWIKVFADWPTAMPGGRASQAVPSFTDAELTAIVDEARRRGRRVAAHATSDAGAAQAVRCGVASIEHVGDLSRATLDLLAERGVFLVPTFSVLGHFAETATADRARDKMRRLLDTAGATFATALQAGVRVVCGTDIGCFPHVVGSRRELAWMRQFGMTAAQALAAATSEAGALLDVPDLGTLRPGAPADLCGFPLAAGSPDDAREVVWGAAGPRFVVAGGRLVRGA